VAPELNVLFVFDQFFISYQHDLNDWCLTPPLTVLNYKFLMANLKNVSPGITFPSGINKNDVCKMFLS
jgi:hypothetical protein